MAKVDGNGRKALVVGASGIVGVRLCTALAETGWTVIAASRRAEPRHDGVESLALDLCDPAACAQAAPALAEVTHLFYSARSGNEPRIQEPASRDLLMLRNLIEVIDVPGSKLEHIHLVHGTKYYGAHLGPYKTPSREDDPRAVPDHFYYQQQDFIAARQAGRPWHWSVSRPHGVYDGARVTARSIPMVIATYASISMALGQPLCFPGTPENYAGLYQCSDCGLLARAIIWIATQPQCRDKAFNVTNGDYIRWQNLWPQIADLFGMKLGPVRTISLAQHLAAREDVWNRLIADGRVQDHPYTSMAMWSYGDFVFMPHWDIASDLTRLRQSGFVEILDTERSLLAALDELRRRNIVL